MSDSDSNSEQMAKKPRLVTTTPALLTDDFDEKDPFKEGTYDDEIELKFDEGKSLFVSKGFLSHSSPVFARMFQSGFKERNSKSMELKGKQFDAFLEMLLFLHPRVQKEFSASSAMTIYKIAHEYQIRPVLIKAEKPLFDYIRSLDPYWGTSELNKCFEMLIFAETYNIKTLQSAAAERISVMPMPSFTGHRNYEELTESTKNKILMYRLKRWPKERNTIISTSLNLDY